ncbi:hypothetical protein RhiJN_10136 [Ceratobasidium sp. AG-Ba]|nr:hypothetical protein RhiJN_10136 [Ceratobasidium sp. AG-Ba]QRW10890.1 hypothetical protein RhiLY_09889 [Ceratobasidium sp. AG-Ba]
MHTNSYPWQNYSIPHPASYRPSSAAYWRPPTATGVERPQTAGHRQHSTAWRRAQEEARLTIKAEQDRLDRLFATETENLKHAEDSFQRKRRSHRADAADYDNRLLHDEGERLQRERERIAKLRADNGEWLSHLIKQETDRIHAAMIEDELAGRLTAEESEWLERNIQKRAAEEQRQAELRAREEEEERAVLEARRLVEEEEAAKLRALQAEELAQAARLERPALPPIPDPEDALALISDPSSTVTTSTEDAAELQALMRLSANPLPRPPEVSPKSRSRPMSTATDDTGMSEADAARRAWMENLKTEWDRRGANEEEHHPVDPPAGPPPPAPSPAPATFRPASYGQPGHNRSYSFAQRYKPASSEDIAAQARAAARRHADEMRRYQEHMEEIKYRERQAARAAREAREAEAARKAFEQERRRLEEERRKKEEEKRKNEEQVIVAAWARYERGWMDLLNGVIADGRQLTFYDIPWPVAMPARSFDELQSGAIERFLLSPYHSTTKTRKMRLRGALMQWHPDKFAQRFVDRIEESHRTAILAAVNSVARTITELMNESD